MRKRPCSSVVARATAGFEPSGRFAGQALRNTATPASGRPSGPTTVPSGGAGSAAGLGGAGRSAVGVLAAPAWLFAVPVGWGESGGPAADRAAPAARRATATRAAEIRTIPRPAEARPP